VRLFLRILATSSVLVTAGCGAGATLTPFEAAVASDPLMRAFSARMDDLTRQAANGDAGAQAALSIVKAEGLRGAPVELAEAETLKKQALSRAAPTTITQYIPGVNGAPGRTALINVPGDASLRLAVRRADECVSVLKREQDRGLEAFLAVLHDEDGNLEAFERGQREAEAICGGKERYAILRSLWDAARPWGDRPLPDCDEDERCQILAQKIARLNARDPAREAKEAAARGDFRLGGFNHIGPMPTGWSLPGVSCTVWTRDMIGKWHVNQDVIMPGDSQHTSAAVGFIAAYNRAMVTDPAFAYADVCAETMVGPAERYEGAVANWGHAARSGDLARLSEVPAGQDVNAPDALGVTALGWAMRRKDEPMAMALLAAGADPRNDPSAGRDEGPPLARALSQKRIELAHRLIEAGAVMEGSTGACRVGFYEAPPEPFTNSGCSWAGLLIQAGAFDLLDQQAAQGRLAAIDGTGDLAGAFLTAAAGRDETIVARLLPHVGYPGSRGGEVLKRLLAQRPDLVAPYVLHHGAEAARSEAEATVWRAAAEGGQREALTFLWDYGADLNLLPPDVLAGCADRARAGDIEGLLGCVEEAGRRRQALHAAIRGGNEPEFARLVAEAADLRERGKGSQLAVAVDSGSLEMVQALLKREANLTPTYAPELERIAYGGSLKARADAVATANGYEQALRHDQSLLQRAAERGDVAMMRALSDAGARGAANLAKWAGNLGNPPAGLNSLFLAADRSADHEDLPNRAVDRDFEVYRLLIAEAARVEGPQSLEGAFASGVYSGYNDALQVMLDAGLDLSKVEAPERIWSSLTQSGTPCKPSTARLLITNRLTQTYAPNAYTHWSPVQSFAVGCADARVADVLVREGGMDVNEVGVDGETALDVAVRYNRLANAEALRRLGGLTAAVVAPDADQARKAERRTQDDLDLEQSTDF